MRSITRSRLEDDCESVYTIYRDAVALLRQQEEEAVRLIGISLYNLSRQKVRQLSLFESHDDHDKKANEELDVLLENLGRKYGLDFKGNLDKLYQSGVLYRTIEYMRKHS